MFKESTFKTAVAASMFSGFFTCVFMTPFDVISTRLFNQGKFLIVNLKVHLTISWFQVLMLMGKASCTETFLTVFTKLWRSKDSADCTKVLCLIIGELHRTRFLILHFGSNSRNIKIFFLPKKEKFILIKSIKDHHLCIYAIVLSLNKVK